MMDMVYNFFVEPLSYDFMQRALIASLSVGTVCAIFSCFLILKGWSLIGDAVSHAVLPGLALSYLIGLPLAIGAFIAGLFCAVATGYIKDHSRVKEDAVMGIVFSGMFALGLVMLTRIETDIHLMHVLFGNVLGITEYDLIETVTIAVLCSAVMLLKRRDFMLYCYDPSHAQVIGLPVRVLHFGMLILLSLTIVSALKAAGIILVVAMLIAPGAVGYLLCKSFPTMMITAIITAITSCFFGTVLSFHFDVSTAPLIIVLQSTFCLFAFFISTLKTNAPHHMTKDQTS